MKLSKLIKATNNNTAEMCLYGDIGSEWADVTPNMVNDFIKQELGAETLNVRINSNGGEISAGQAIYSALKRCEAQINVYIDGLAASMGSVIAMAGDTVYMPSNSLMMIHNPATGVWGDANDFRKVANELDKWKSTILTTYISKSKQDEDVISKMMDDETWLTAQECLDLGLIDVIEDKKIESEIVENRVVFNSISFDFKDEKIKQIKAKTHLGNRTSGLDIKTKNKEEKVLNIEDFKKTYPDLYNQISKDSKNKGANEERDRIKAIDELSVLAEDEKSKEIINKAKFESDKTAENIALDLLKANATTRADMLTNRMIDATIINNVGATTLDPEFNKIKAEEDTVINMIANFAKQKKGVK